MRVALLLLAAFPAQGKPKAPAIEPGKVVDRKATNGMTYALRVPKSYDPKRGARALVILHGSNMSGRAYVETVVANSWFPDDVLIGPDGENPGGSAGAHNFGFESAGPVVGVFDEVSKELKITKAFVGGHSQGGFLTWSVLMNHADRFAGAFPMAGGLWRQCEPEVFERDEAKTARQREIAIAVIHGRADPVVEFSYSESATLAFVDAGFPKIRLFAPEALQHQFGLSPLPEAIDWLEAMTTSEATAALAAGQAAWKAKDARSASVLAARAEKLAKGEGTRRQAKDLVATVEKAAEEGGKALLPKIAAARDDAWVAEFCAYRESYGTTKAAAPVLAAYSALRKKQRGRGDALWAERSAAMDRNDEAKAREADAKIVSDAFATKWYYFAKRALEPAGGKAAGK